MKVSMVIPFYKVERYIDRCLKSCVRQSGVRLGEDYEIICINDGSSDNSENIVKEYAEKYPYIRLISQENKGLSVARNVGTNSAKGEYIWYIDSDDWIEENSLERILPYLIDDLDILELQYRCISEEGKPKDVRPQRVIEGIKTGREVLLSGKMGIPAQFAVYRACFLRNNNLKFMKGIFHEDAEFRPRVMYLARKVRMLKGVVYNYLIRKEGSITSKPNLKRCIDILIVNESLRLFSANLRLCDEFAFNRCIATNMNTLLSLYWQLPADEQEEVRRLIKQNMGLFKRMMRSNRLKYFVEGLIISIDLKVGLCLHRIVKEYK